MKNKLRIFISSPSDVNLERGIAKRVIEELQTIYRGYIELETLMWEDLPLAATNSFQNGIDYFLNAAPVDIAIFILWSRLGSTLGHTFRKPDGSEYLSGTEYEFDTMYTLWRTTGNPKIMVYVKDVEVQFANGMSTVAIKDALKQQEMLHSFIGEKFHDAETNTNYAYWQFDKQQTFEERLRTHLKKLIIDAIGKNVNVREWEGNPYVGLNSFTFEQSAIYCGRKDMVYEVAQKLTLMDQKLRQPLLVLGESGSGKPSFIKAGLLPHFVNYGSTVTKEHVNEIIPSVFHNNIYSGIINILVNEFPYLKGNPVLDELNNGIEVGYNFSHLKYALDNSCSELKTVFLLDQFEELFSDNEIQEQERIRTFILLRGLCEIRCIQMIFSMRSDFYNVFSRYPDLHLIKNNAIVVDLPKVLYEGIIEIVEEPARKANLSWEINDKGVKLSRQIAQDAFALGELPLIEFGLSELYNACKSTQILTYEAYESIGKLNGAIIKYADKVYNGFTEQEKSVFSDMLGTVITISDKEGKLFVRKTSLMKDVARSKLRKDVLQQLVDAHLFVSGKNSAGEATITIVHEMLINFWSVIREWCNTKAQFLKQNDYYQKQAGYWAADNKSVKGLIQERSLLLQAEYFLFKYEKLLTPLTHEFITKSLKKQRRKGLVKHCFLFPLIILVALSTIVSILGILPVDHEMKQWYEGLTLWDILILVSGAIALSGRALWLRITGIPDYKTIGATMAMWWVFTALLFAEALFEMFKGVSDWYALLIPLIFFLVSISMSIEYYRRLFWKKSIFKPYLISDKFAILKNIVIYSLSIIFLLGLLFLYVNVLTTKNESLESTIAVADDLFYGLNNISHQLSPADNIYVNEKRLNYLYVGFNEQLTDDIPDDRDFEYATCLYNLSMPLESMKNLYPDKGYSEDILLYILNCAKIGDMHSADYYLEKYIEAEFYDNLNWASPVNLSWIAEKCGRFDLAEILYGRIESNGIDWRTADESFLVNYGHICLSKGEFQQAYIYYDSALELHKAKNPYIKTDIIKSNIENSILQDLNYFAWAEVLAPSILDKVFADRKYKKMNFYTSSSDVSETEKYKSHVAGQWLLTDSTIIMTYSDNHPICQYKGLAKDSQGNVVETGRNLTYYRVSSKTGTTYIEEFCEQTGTISQGKVLLLTEDRLEIKIIENGIPEDKEKIRVYTKYIP